MIASHYAEAIERRTVAETGLRAAPCDDADVLVKLDPGEPFWILDDSLGWAWGYAGKDHRVGYVKSKAINA